MINPSTPTSLGEHGEELGARDSLCTPLRVAPNFSGQHSPQAELLRGHFSQSDLGTCCFLQSSNFSVAFHSCEDHLRSIRCTFSVFGLEDLQFCGDWLLHFFPSLEARLSTRKIIQLPDRSNGFRRNHIVLVHKHEKAISPRRTPSRRESGLRCPKGWPRAPQDESRAQDQRREAFRFNHRDTRGVCICGGISFWPCQMSCWTRLPSCRYQRTSDTANQGRVSNLRIWH